MTEENANKAQNAMTKEAEQTDQDIVQLASELSVTGCEPDTDQEKSSAQVEAEEELKNQAKYKVEDAISFIMSENTCDFKDFHFPTKKLDVLLYRMHHEINGRIQAFKEDHMDVQDIITAYRSRHSKADDIKFITKTYKAMELHSERAAVRPMPTAELANQNAGALASSSRSFLPVLFEPIGAQAAGLVPRERAQIRRNSSTRRSVRFQSSPARECRQEDDIKE